MTTVQLTGPQLEVIALLADGKDVNEIAAITKGTQASVNGHIRDACLALGANDRIHLIAVAYRAGLLHVPAQPAEVQQLRDRLDQAAETVTMLTRQRDHARKAASVAETKLKEAPPAPPAEPAPAAAADPLDIAQAQGDIERLKRQARAATDRADRAERALLEEKLKNTPTTAGEHGAGPWAPAIAHLERLAVLTRDAAQRGGLTMLHTAKGVDLSIAALRRAGGA